MKTNTLKRFFCIILSIVLVLILGFSQSEISAVFAQKDTVAETEISATVQVQDTAVPEKTGEETKSAETPLSASGEFEAVINDDISVYLIWSIEDERITSFLIERTLLEQDNWQVLISVGAEERTFTDDTTEWGKAYRYRIRAYSEELEVFSEFSEEIRLTLPVNPQKEQQLIIPFDFSDGETIWINSQYNNVQISENKYPAISLDGKFIVFPSEQNPENDASENSWELYVQNLETGERSSVAGEDGWPMLATISADGRYIAFISNATDLVTPETDGTRHVFVYDTQTSETTIVSVSSEGVRANAQSSYPQISADGRYVSFESNASNLVNNDTNNDTDIFLHDLKTGETIRVSKNIDGSQREANCTDNAISDDGHFIAYTVYEELAEGFYDYEHTLIYVYDQINNVTELITTTFDGASANGASGVPDLSADGRYIVFASNASNLISSDENGVGDIFLFDKETDTISLISINSNGEQVNSASSSPVISANGRYVAFYSYASNLVENDTNGYADIFLLDRIIDEVTLISVSTEGQQGNGDSKRPEISADGNKILFTSKATNFREEKNSNYYDIYVHGRSTVSTIDEYEEDAVFVLATSIESAQTQTHSISPVWDEDWLTFSISEDSDIILETSGVSGNTQLRLYDSELNLLNFDENSGNGDFSRIEDELIPGTYYVKINETGNNDTIDAYQVNLSITPCSQSEKLRNAGFEIFAPDYWGSANLVVGIDGNDCVNKHGGNCSGKMIGNGTNKQFRYVTLADVHAGDMLNFDFWSKAQSADGIYFAKVVLYNTADSSTQSVMIVPNSGTHNWEKYSSGMIMADGTYNRIRVYLLGARSGTVWYDDISISLNGIEMIRGQGFEVFIPDLWQSVYLNGQFDGPDTGIVHSGDASGKIVGDGNNKQFRYVAIVDIDTGDPVQFGFWTRSQSAFTKYFAKIVFYSTADRRTQGTMVVPAQGTNGWTYYSTGIIIADGEYDRARIYLLGPGSGTVWYDDISVIQ